MDKEEIEKKISDLTDRYLEGKVSPDTYTKKVRVLQEERDKFPRDTTDKEIKNI